MRPGSGYGGGDWAPGESQGDWMPTETWKLKRFILPRVCYASGEWSGFFPKMYVGTKTFPISNDTITVLVSPKVYLFKKLKGEKIVDWF